MSRKPMMHGCYDIHVKGVKRKPQYENVREGNWGAYILMADYTLCGVNARSAYWRRKPIKISEKWCPRTVTCKRCVASINMHKRIRNNAK